MASAHEMHEAKAEVKKEGKSKLHHLRVHPHKGGHMVTHHAHNTERYGPEHEEKPMATHVFGKEEGEALMKHIAKHAKVVMPEAAEGAEPEQGQQEEAEEGED